MIARASGAISIPVSATATSIPPSHSCALSAPVPRWVNFTALPIRFFRIIADERRRTVVHAHQIRDVLSFLAAFVDLHRREAHALSPDVAGVGVVAAAHAAVGVGVMALDAGDEHQLAVVEDGREDVVVRPMPAAMIRIIGDEHVAVVEAVRSKELQREAYRQRRAEHELRDADTEDGGHPEASRMVALRSFDWLRIGVVAVKLTCVAIS